MLNFIPKYPQTKNYVAISIYHVTVAIRVMCVYDMFLSLFLESYYCVSICFAYALSIKQ